MSAVCDAGVRELEAPPPLRRDAMARQWLGLRALSDAGDQVWTVALAWTAVHVASPAAAGAVVAAGTLPRAVLLLLGGVVADRADTRRVLVLANLARVGLLLAVVAAVLLAPPTLGLLLAAAVALGIADAVHEPSAATVGRQIVRTADLPAYAGAGQTAIRLGTMAGAAVGGIVVATLGLGGSALVDAVTFAAVAAFLVLRMRPRFALPRAAAEPPWRSVASGFAHLRRERLTRTVVLALSGLNLFVGPAVGVGLALRVRDAGWGAGAVGLCLALLGAGAALGSLATVRWRPRREAVAGFGWLVVQGLAIVVLGTGPLWLTAVAATVVGVTSGVASVLLSAVFQATVDAAYLGRMAALQRLGDDALMPVATVGFGALAALALPLAFTAYGVTMAVAVCLPLADPALRGLGLRDP